ncbi:MAG: cytochrome c biogenesis protein CcsA [Deltaproteobacteria bacterium]|nr:cytochrome c biogenesis protein CcsA [Deltaproteobacteria bacterium]
MDLLFFKASLTVYLISTLGYVMSLIAKRVLVARISTGIMAVAFLLHSVYLITRYLHIGFSPVLTRYDTLSFFTWVLAGIYLILQFRTKTRVLGAFVAPVTSLLMIMASAGLEEAVTIPEMLQGGLVTVHAALSVAGEALFVLACCAGAMYLIQDGFIKKRKVNPFSRLLPSLRDLDRINHVCLVVGFPLLTLGVLAGSIWARSVWGSHWQWDPKQVWTLVAWIVYAVLLHQRLAIGWKGHRAALFSILSLVVLFLSLLIVNRCFLTVHSFV